VDADAVSDNILQNSVVRSRSAAGIVFGLKAVDRDGEIESRQCGPVCRKWTKRAGDELNVDTALD
jgi:hypothetical protein